MRRQRSESPISSPERYVPRPTQRPRLGAGFQPGDGPEVVGPELEGPEVVGPELEGPEVEVEADEALRDPLGVVFDDPRLTSDMPSMITRAFEKVEGKAIPGGSPQDKIRFLTHAVLSSEQPEQLEDTDHLALHEVFFNKTTIRLQIKNLLETVPFVTSERSCGEFNLPPSLANIEENKPASRSALVNYAIIVAKMLQTLGVCNYRVIKMETILDLLRKMYEVKDSYVVNLKTHAGNVDSLYLGRHRIVSYKYGKSGIFWTIREANPGEVADQVDQANRTMHHRLILSAEEHGILQNSEASDHFSLGISKGDVMEKLNSYFGARPSVTGLRKSHTGYQCYYYNSLARDFEADVFSTNALTTDPPAILLPVLEDEHKLEGRTFRILSGIVFSVLEFVNISGKSLIGQKDLCQLVSVLYRVSQEDLAMFFYNASYASGDFLLKTLQNFGDSTARDGSVRINVFTDHHGLKFFNFSSGIMS